MKQNNNKSYQMIIFKIIKRSNYNISLWLALMKNLKIIINLQFYYKTIKLILTNKIISNSKKVILIPIKLNNSIKIKLFILLIINKIIINPKIIFPSPKI